MDVREMIKKQLRLLGADGLGLCNRGCGCCMDDSDWPPCDGIQPDCVAAVKRLCRCGDWFMAPLGSTQDKCEVCQET
jgi:hypothetical protein